MNKQQVSLADQWAGQSCTLNGKPAKITGRLLPHGIVSEINGPISHEWAWKTIDRIMRKDKAFKS